MSLDFPLSVGQESFFLSQKGKGAVFLLCFFPVPEMEILDFIAQGSIIQGFTVEYQADPCTFWLFVKYTQLGSVVRGQKRRNM